MNSHTQNKKYFVRFEDINKTERNKLLDFMNDRFIIKLIDFKNQRIENMDDP